MSTPYTTEVNKEANLQFIVTECQQRIQSILMNISVIESTLSFTGVSIKERDECEEALRDYKVELVSWKNNLDEALDNLLGQSEDETPNWWEQQEETSDLWSKLLS